MRIRVAQAQFSPAFGDYAANLRRVGEFAAQAVEERCDLLILPETSLSGYFLEGAVAELARTKESALQDLWLQFRDHCPKGSKLDILVGLYELFQGNIYNSALYASMHAEDGGQIRHAHRKVFLPTYGIFDEQRFVARGRRMGAFETAYGRVAMLVCEDVWHSIMGSIAALRGAHFIHAISSSPGRGLTASVPCNVRKWTDLIAAMAEEHAVFVTHTSRVGFENGKGFAGGSVVVGPSGDVLNEGPLLDEALLVTELDPRDLQVARASQSLVTDLTGAANDLAAEFAAATHAAWEEA